MTQLTYIISAEMIENAFSMADYVSTIEQSFELYGRGEVQMPPKVYLTFDKGDLRCMPVYIPAMNTAGVKNVNVHPANDALPAVMATITLIDPETGFPLAIMDGTHITRMRTGAAGGVAAKYLARTDSKTAACIGTGTQAATQLEALLITRPTISKVVLFDISLESMKHFARLVKQKHGLKATCANSVEEAVKNADIVTTTTTVRSPIVKSEWIKPGTHINAIGADAKGKQELDPAILKHAKVVIDNWAQASHSGEINVAVTKGLITQKDIHADIGQIATAKKPARQNPEEITVFDSTGLAIQDISAATMIYRKLTSDETLKAKLETFEFF
ncbi:MAG: ornithine cyclodeaminase family protein [Planctomycetes bacterium]|nr:ornithine cyclodeaminase family protein [Planctomycetota bacterium]